MSLVYEVFGMSCDLECRPGESLCDLRKRAKYIQLKTHELVYNSNINIVVYPRDEKIVLDAIRKANHLCDLWMNIVKYKVKYNSNTMNEIVLNF